MHANKEKHKPVTFDICSLRNNICLMKNIPPPPKKKSLDNRHGQKKRLSWIENRPCSGGDACTHLTGRTAEFGEKTCILYISSVTIAHFQGRPPPGNSRCIWNHVETFYCANTVANLEVVTPACQIIAGLLGNMSGARGDPSSWMRHRSSALWLAFLANKNLILFFVEA